MTDTLPAVSIVVPMYNCGDILRSCLTSIQNQRFTDFEVIMVNNRSTDNSPAIAAEFAALDSRFRLLQCTGGLAGSSRNTGIAAARGEYLAFVDGDDRLDEQFLERLYTAAKKADADIAVCGFHYYFLNTQKTERDAPPPEKLLSRDEALHCLLRDKYLRFYLWNKLWRRRLFTEHEIKIPDMYYEDAVVTPKLFYYANRVACISYCGYYYTRAFSKYTEVSMSHQRANDYVNTIPMIRLFLEEKNCYPQFKGSFRTHIFHVYFAIPFVVRQLSEESVNASRENIRRARAKIRLCCKAEPDKLRQFDLEKPVIE